MKKTCLKKLAKARFFDIDDLILMRVIVRGGTFLDAANILALTPQAVCHRCKKIEEIFGNIWIMKNRLRKSLTPKGVDLFKRYDEALKLLEE